MILILFFLCLFLSGCDKQEMEKDAMVDSEKLAEDVIKDSLNIPNK